MHPRAWGVYDVLVLCKKGVNSVVPIGKQRTMGSTHLNPPIDCALWDRPELVEGAIKDQFHLVEAITNDPHHWRYLLECRECRQRYFYEFLEEIDWERGNDPQYTTYVPVESDAEVEALTATTPRELREFSPRIQRDWPSDAAAPTTRWIGRD